MAADLDDGVSDWGPTTGPYASAWVGGSDAYFEGTAGTVNVGTVSSVKSITFSTYNYLLSGGTLTMSVSGGVTTTAPAPTRSVP